MRGLSLVAASGGYSSLRCAGFSVWWLLLLWSTGSRRTGFSSCGARASLLRGMWDLPGPGLEPVSPALAGGFLTTVPPGKPCKSLNQGHTGYSELRQLHVPSGVLVHDTVNILAHNTYLLPVERCQITIVNSAFIQSDDA